MPIDIYTILFSFILFTPFYGFSLYAVQANSTNTLGVKPLAWAIVFIGVGALMVSFRNVGGIFLTVMVANLLLALGFLLTTYGLYKFSGQRSRCYKYGLYLIIPLAVSMWYYTYIEPSIQSRVFIMSTYIAWVVLVAIPSIWGKNIKSGSPVKRTMSAMMVFLGFVFIYRALNSLNLITTVGLDDRPFIHVLTAYTMLAFLMTTSSFVIWELNARNAYKLMLLSNNDPLTNLYNRRALDKYVSTYEKNMSSNDLKSYVLLIDVDHFKQINDTHGHVVGDSVIRTTADIIRSELRHTDLTFRYGGEEFLTILPDSDDENSLHVANKILSKFRQYPVLKDPNLYITVSIGIAPVLPDREFVVSISNADSALYAAKKHGRDRVCCSNSST